MRANDPYSTSCPGCGQTTIPSSVEPGEPAYCADCLARMYGGDERHERARLFTPPPTQVPGQTDLGLDGAP